ncbi:unnamed protein product [Anisakis simplex]|uniref:Peroxin-14 n=1 Tax=Anisakis simplex TaxID=6269 RepID=A0A0M3KBW1_ANISI|nr:unnamed protein product [Anisakis simplex]
MGLPMVQVFMIAARQISRPIADRVIRYGKTHGVFRNRLLIPLGRGLAHLTTRLRMKHLGLGRPATLAPVSEEAALEQASDFVQQVVLFSYSVAVFASYYFYTKQTAPETVKAELFYEFKKDSEEKLNDLNDRLERIEKLLLKNVSSSSSATNDGKVWPKDDEKCAESEGQQVATSSSERPRFKRISSLPVDETVKVVVSGNEQYVIARRGTSVSIEPLEIVQQRRTPFKFRHQPASASKQQHTFFDRADNDHDTESDNKSEGDVSNPQYQSSDRAPSPNCEQKMGL